MHTIQSYTAADSIFNLIKLREDNNPIVLACDQSGNTLKVRVKTRPAILGVIKCLKKDI